MYDNTFSVGVSPRDIACHFVVAALVCRLHTLHSLVRSLGSLSFFSNEHVLSQSKIYAADCNNCFWQFVLSLRSPAIPVCCGLTVQFRLRQIAHIINFQILQSIVGIRITCLSFPRLKLLKNIIRFSIWIFTRLSTPLWSVHQLVHEAIAEGFFELFFNF